MDRWRLRVDLYTEFISLPDQFRLIQFDFFFPWTHHAIPTHPYRRKRIPDSFIFFFQLRKLSHCIDQFILTADRCSCKRRHPLIIITLANVDLYLYAACVCLNIPYMYTIYVTAVPFRHFSCHVLYPTVHIKNFSDIADYFFPDLMIRRQHLHPFRDKKFDF